MRDSQDAFHGTSAAPERAAVPRLQAHRLASVSVFASMMLLLPGCEGALSSGSADQPRPASSPSGTTIDSGIILSDQDIHLPTAFDPPRTLSRAFLSQNRNAADPPSTSNAFRRLSKLPKQAYVTFSQKQWPFTLPRAANRSKNPIH